MKSIVKIAILLLLVQGNRANAQNNPALDGYLSAVYKDHIIPGFAVVVVKKGEIIFSKGYGVESLGVDKPFTPKTVCAVGSLTKSMTAMAMMQLVEQKKVELNKPVTHYLPWFRTANKERSDKITVRMLLNNTSGLYSGSSSQSDDIKENSLENLVRSLASTYLTREPGIAYEYSNAGFSVAGLIISKVTGMFYQQYMHDKVFQPLKMFHTSTDPKDFEKLKTINGHYYGNHKAIAAVQENNVESNGYTPAGSLMYSSTEDLGKYLIALMNTGKDEIISIQSRNEMWKPNISFPGITKEDGGDAIPFSYGLGWMISSIEGRRIIHHGGSTGKMSSFTMIDPQNETSASILLNVDLTFINKYAYPTEITIINNIMRLATGLPISKYGIPTVKDPTINNYILNDTRADQYTGEYQLKSENVIFLYAGADMQIRKSGNQVECVISRGNQIINQFTLDFINEALAVSRNIASPVQLRFKLDPEGRVSGLFFGDMEFIRQDEKIGARFTTIFSTDNKFSFKLPIDWKITWNKNYFNAQNYNGSIQMKGYIRKEAKSASMETIMDEVLDSCLIKERGILHSEKFGKYQWKEKSFLCSINNSVKQVIAIQSMIESNNIYMILITREGELTTNIQDIANYLLNSIRVRERN